MEFIERWLGMRFLVLVILVASNLSWAGNDTPQCEELNKRATATMAKMDEALKLKTGYLLGEMEMSKQAILKCVDQNKLVETRASLLWFMTELGMLLISALFGMHHRKMKKAILALNKSVAAERPEHLVTYMPNQWFMRSLVLSLIAGFVGTNLVALFL